MNGAVGLDGVPNIVQTSGQEDAGTVNYAILNSDATDRNDHRDLDSEDDSCNDASEAGYTESGTNTGELEGTGYDTAIGLVTGNTDGYTTPADGDVSLEYEYCEAGVAPSISTQPINAQTCPGCSALFTVATSNSDTYQWQKFNGTAWNDLSDGVVFSVTTTNTLTITGPTTANNVNQFRVIVSNSSFVRVTETSNTVVLTIKVNTVITNRRITYRVKKIDDFY